MITRRQVVRLLGSTSAGALFVTVPSRLYFPAAQESSTSQLSVPPDLGWPGIWATNAYFWMAEGRR